MSDLASLRKHIEELKKKREQIVEERNKEYESIRELSAAPEPEALRNINAKSAKLSLVRPAEDIELKPTSVQPKAQKVQLYYREVQTDPLPEPTAIVVEKRSPVKIEVDDSPEWQHDFVENSLLKTKEKNTLNERILAADYHTSFWNKSFSGVQQFPVDVAWSGHSVALAMRPLSVDKAGSVYVYDANNLEEATSLQFGGQPTVVTFVPDSSDLVVVGGMTGQLSVYDTRAGAAPIADSKRWIRSHYWQVVSVMFSTRLVFRTIDADGKILGWNMDRLGSRDVKAARDEITVDKVANGKVTAACLNNSGEMIVGFETGLVGRKSVRQGTQLREVRKYRGPITGLDFRDGRLAVSSLAGQVDIWTKDSCIKTIESLSDSFVDCCWKPAQSPTVAICGCGKDVILHDIESNQETKISIDGVKTCSAFNSEGSVMCLGSVIQNEGTFSLIRCHGRNE